jgi:hypothetical protein
MEYNKANFKTWEEASRWMQKHGYGVEQIRLEKEKWDAEPVKTATVAEPVKTAPKPATKTTETKTGASTTTKTK